MITENDLVLGATFYQSATFRWTVTVTKIESNWIYYTSSLGGEDAVNDIWYCKKSQFLKMCSKTFDGLFY